MPATTQPVRTQETARTGESPLAKVSSNSAELRFLVLERPERFETLKRMSPDERLIFLKAARDITTVFTVIESIGVPTTKAETDALITLLKSTKPDSIFDKTYGKKRVFKIDKYQQAGQLPYAYDTYAPEEPASKHQKLFPEQMCNATPDNLPLMTAAFVITALRGVPEAKTALLKFALQLSGDYRDTKNYLKGQALIAALPKVLSHKHYSYGTGRRTESKRMTWGRHIWIRGRPIIKQSWKLVPLEAARSNVKARNPAISKEMVLKLTKDASGLKPQEKTEVGNLINRLFKSLGKEESD